MGDVVDLTIEILKQIRDGVNGTNERLDRVELRLERVEDQQVQTNARLLQVEARQAETNARLDVTNARLDVTNARLEHLVRSSGAQWRSHERRIEKLEESVTQLRSQRA